MPPGSNTPHSYTRGERLGDAALHGVGIVAAVVGCLALASMLARNASAGIRVAFATYAFGLLVMLVCSALYNLGQAGRHRQLLQKLDHSAIFLMIAGTYTPIAVVGLGGIWRCWLLGTVWAGAIGGIIVKLVAPKSFERLSILMYLFLGWTGLLAAYPIVTALAVQQVVLIVTGGAFYSLGIVFHRRTQMKYHNLCWHGMVMAGALSHFLVVYQLAAGNDK